MICPWPLSIFASAMFLLSPPTTVNTFVSKTTTPCLNFIPYDMSQQAVGELIYAANYFEIILKYST